MLDYQRVNPFVAREVPSKGTEVLALESSPSVFQLPCWIPKGAEIIHRSFYCIYIYTVYIYMGMDQYLYIPFLGGWTSIYQLVWCSPGVQGFDTLPYIHWHMFEIFRGKLQKKQRNSLGSTVYEWWTSSQWRLSQRLALVQQRRGRNSAWRGSKS